jgi:protocatechuate 3,4-dioxygenase beta subunit
LLIVLAAATMVAGCEGGNEPPGPQPSVSGSASPTPPAGCARPAAGQAAAGSELIPAPSNGLPKSAAVGQILVIEAVVLDRGCRPAAGADVHLWHADAQGLYGPAGTQRCCYYDGTVRADQNGRFRLRTIRPAQYPVPNAPPAHIHLEIGHPAGNLGTEIIFDGQPPTGLLTPTSGQLAVTLRQDGVGWRGEAVFVLPGIS